MGTQISVFVTIFLILDMRLFIWVRYNVQTHKKYPISWLVHPKELEMGTTRDSNSTIHAIQTAGFKYLKFGIFTQFNSKNHFCASKQNVRLKSVEELKLDFYNT
jgi:hypothetical protein